MHYISTRGKSEKATFSDILLTGLAPDGGLYVPEQWPHFSVDRILSWKGLAYERIASMIMKPFLGDVITENELISLLFNSYKSFDHDLIVPLKPLRSNVWLLELFHGPTLSFKDIALQFLGRLVHHILNKSGKRITIITATSGDTGSAAIEAFKSSPNVDIVVLHPKGRTSEIQRKQMTTVQSPNVKNIAIEGNFDDCQNIVKTLFADQSFREKMNLTSVNSINWGRIIAQIPYYFASFLEIANRKEPISFTVPTGNFGNIFAGYAAKQMGLPIQNLVIASNKNDILTRFFEENDMSIKTAQASLSPSMDIQVSSNFERFLFDLCYQNGEQVELLMEKFKKLKKLPIDKNIWLRAKRIFHANSVSDDETKKTIKQVFAETGMSIDPHTAVGVACTKEKFPLNGHMVVLSTAHPSKFPDVVKETTGFPPMTPAKLKKVLNKPEEFVTMSKNINDVKSYLYDTIEKKAA